MFCSVSVINHIEIEKREKETDLGGVWKDMGGSEAYEVIIYGSKHVRLLHLFPPNLGGSARILDKVHPISAVRHISQLN